MISITSNKVIGKLNDECRQVLDSAADLAMTTGSDVITVGHILYKFAERPYSDVSVLLKQKQISHESFMRQLADGFVRDRLIDGQKPQLERRVIETLQEAWLLASVENTQTHIRSGTFLLAVLMEPKLHLPKSLIVLLKAINCDELRASFNKLLASSEESISDEDNNGVGNKENRETTEDNDYGKGNGEERSAASSAIENGHIDNNPGGGQTPLDCYAVNVTAQAQAGKIDPVLCRDDEIDLMIDILSRRRKNNPIAVGEAGVGKSALVEGLALRVVSGQVPEQLRDVGLWSLDIGAMQAGASVKGEFEKRLKAVIDQVKEAPKPIILFIDEAHTLIGAGNPAGGSDAANLLKPELARGELRVIAATTWSEYKKYFEKDAALTRRFQLVTLNEPDIEQAVHIMRGLSSLYEEAHGVHITDSALVAAAMLSSRYLSGRQLPDKSIDVLDTAAARVSTGLTTPPKALARLDNRKQQAEAEIEQLQREQQHGHTVNDERIAVLRRQINTYESEQAAIQRRWQEQKALVEKIIEARRQLAMEDGEGNQSDLAQSMEDLQALQKEEALINADVDEKQIALVISDWTGIPVNTLTGDRLDRLCNLDAFLNNSILGQKQAVQTIHNHLLTSMADLKRPGTPLGAFLLIGPSGVGKTETALQIADRLFGGKQFLTTINLSEYQEKHSVSRLIGSPPGYVGYGEGGVLSEAIRQKPYSVVLLDEVEKAHPDIFNLFYQAFDKGEFADGEGRIIDCKNNLFFLTSNLGFDDASSHLMETGLDNDELRQRLRQFFKPALLARMQVVRFDFLSDGTIAAIVEHRLDKLKTQFQTRYRAPLTIDDSVTTVLQARCTQRENGARMLDASIEGELLPPLSLQVLTQAASGEPLISASLRHVDGSFIAECLTTGAEG